MSQTIEVATSVPLKSQKTITNAADIHSHILWGIDDGAVSIQASLEMARVAVSDGIEVMAATPHRFYAGRENTPQVVRELVSRLNEALRNEGMADEFRVIAGQELTLTLEVADEYRNSRVMSYGDYGRYVLVEPPFEWLPDWAEQALRNLIDVGVHPVLAHPERNATIQNDPSAVVKLFETGAYLQLTAMSVTGNNGNDAKAAADWMLERGLAYCISSDSHSPTWRPPCLSLAYQRIESIYGNEMAEQLCVINPQNILSDNKI